jgi:hypothetical protein
MTVAADLFALDDEGGDLVELRVAGRTRGVAGAARARAAGRLDRAREREETA